MFLLVDSWDMEERARSYRGSGLSGRCVTFIESAPCPGGLTSARVRGGQATMSEPDWTQLRERVRRYLSAHARKFNLNPADIDDLCSDAVLAVVRYGKSHTIDDPEALLITCAQRAAKDLAASRRRWRIIDAPLDSNLTALTSAHSADTTLGDPVIRVRAIVVLIFRSREQGCLRLAQAYFREMSWHDVADSVGQSATAIRQQWSRCVKKLRAVIAEDKKLAQLLDLCLTEDTP